MQTRYPIDLLACLVLFTACSPNATDPSAENVWIGSYVEFAAKFQVQGGLICDSEGIPYSGKVILREDSSDSFSIKMDNGRPLIFQNSQKKGVPRWQLKDLWIGTDSSWEEDFEERPEGLFLRKSGLLYSGKIISIDERTGSIQVEYNYQDGVSHGPEIYFNENQQESSRQNWVNGKIPLSRL